MVDETTTAESPEESGAQKLDYVLVRHMARSPRTKALRAARAGHRRQGVLLDDGTRIRRKGKRLTTVTLADLADNHQRLLEYVRVGTLEALDPVTEHPIPYEELVKIVAGTGTTVVESGIQSGPIDGSDVPENTAPSTGVVASTPTPPPVVEESTKDGPKDDGPKDDGPSGEVEGHTEEDLLAMKLADLKTLAVDVYGCDEADIKKMKSKQEVVEAIFASEE